MRILVTFAVQNEFAPWRRMRGFRRAATEPSLYEAQVGAAEVCVGLTGIGPQHARRALQIALAQGADFCISTGLAGALQVRYRIGDILVARTVRNVSGGNLVKSDAELLRTAAACGAREVNAFQSSDHTVLSAKEKGRLSNHADAVEMDIRAIGDLASQDMPLDFNRTVGSKGQISIPLVFGQLALNPHRLPALVRLGRDTQRAATCLANFLDHFVETLAAGRRTEEVHEEVAIV
jgi:phosphorylase superfamily protein